jgi:hypothetical protein
MAQEDNYSVKGRVIDGHQAPVGGVVVRVMHGSEKPLAETKTDDAGRFSILLDRGQLNRTLGGLRRAPKVHLELLKPDGPVLFSTRETPIAWQLEFRIYLGSDAAVPDAPDLYSGSMRRMVGGMRASGVSGRAMKSMGQGGSKEKGEEPGAWERVTAILQSPSELDDTLNMAFGAMDGVLGDATRRSPLKLVSYDGAQVPRRAWSAPDHQAIIWPRKEPFKWE